MYVYITLVIVVGECLLQEVCNETRDETCVFIIIIIYTVIIIFIIYYYLYFIILLLS